ncbi:hypothetical protein TSH7_22825 [Azospirillum sp. TSH7]|uniref:hypothetical protein n=1 Tax=unclassified Azospirillum TaxID=2630922 RepID=UPI000D6170E6|nr:MULTISPECIES: hypothetical protein [unclassified Azospirillum]PWC58378.1 hypothetical protein TSH7_22825 [Azospirillum sp. TSH7]PWC70414.1 hypothetical protein TSH20_05690 [Azospirillum sp. TSH20]
MQSLLRVLAVLLNIAMLMLAAYALSKFGWPRRDSQDQVLITILLLAPVVNLLAILMKNNFRARDSWISMEIEARKAVLRKRINGQEADPSPQ